MQFAIALMLAAASLCPAHAADQRLRLRPAAEAPATQGTAQEDCAALFSGHPYTTVRGLDVENMKALPEMARRAILQMAYDGTLASWDAVPLGAARTLRGVGMVMKAASTPEGKPVAAIGGRLYALDFLAPRAGGYRDAARSAVVSAAPKPRAGFLGRLRDRWDYLSTMTRGFVLGATIGLVGIPAAAAVDIMVSEHPGEHRTAEVTQPLPEGVRAEVAAMMAAFPAAWEDARESQLNFEHGFGHHLVLAGVAEEHGVNLLGLSATEFLYVHRALSVTMGEHYRRYFENHRDQTIAVENIHTLDGLAPLFQFRREVESSGRPELVEGHGVRRVLDEIIWNESSRDALVHRSLMYHVLHESLQSATPVEGAAVFNAAAAMVAGDRVHELRLAETFRAAAPDMIADFAFYAALSPEGRMALTNLSTQAWDLPAWLEMLLYNDLLTAGRPLPSTAVGRCARADFDAEVHQRVLSSYDAIHGHDPDRALWLLHFYIDTTDGLSREALIHEIAPRVLAINIAVINIPFYVSPLVASPELTADDAWAMARQATSVATVNRVLTLYLHSHRRTLSYDDAIMTIDRIADPELQQAELTAYVTARGATLTAGQLRRLQRRIHDPAMRESIAVIMRAWH